MPKVLLDVLSTEQTTSHMVAHSVASELIHLFDIERETPIIAPDGTSAKLNVTTARKPKRNYGSTAVRISYSDEYNDARWFNSNYRGASTEPLFVDDVLGIKARPVYARKTMTMSVKMTFSSLTVANAARSRVRETVIRGGRDFVNELNYEYLMPTMIPALLTIIYDLREGYMGTGETMRQWFTRCMAEKVGLSTNATGTRGAMAINERQLDVVGRFDFDIQPQRLSKDNESAKYIMEFTYTFDYDTPQHIEFVYPEVVHNQLLPDDFLPDYNPYEMFNQNRRGDLLGEQLVSYTEPRYFQWPGGVPVPSFNSWLPKSKPIYAEAVCRIMCLVDVVDPTLVCNLKDLGDVAIVDEVLEYFEKEYPYLTGDRTSLFHLVHYIDDHMYATGSLVVDQDLTVRTRVPMEPKSRHQIVLYVYKRPSALERSALDRLRSYSEICPILLNAVNVDIPFSEMPTVNSVGVIDKKEFDRTIDMIDKPFKMKQTADVLLMTIGNYAVKVE